MRLQIRKAAYAVAIAAVAATFVIASATSSEAAKKKKAAAKPAPQAICMTGGAQVCATKGKLKFTYANSCFAGNDGAVVVSQKACSTPKAKKSGKKSGKKAGKKGDKKAPKK